jgi:hypothetical protein
LGSYTYYRDFEVRNSDPDRWTDNPGSSPPDMQRDHGAAIEGSHNKLINLIVRDAESGVIHSTSGVGNEVVGCLIFNNGWQSSDRGHGHAMYLQNRYPTLLVRDNIIFNQFGHGIHAYGSENAFVQEMIFEGNISFNNGSPQGGRESNLYVSGGAAADNIVVRNNSMWMPQSARNLEMAFGNAAGQRATVEGNMLMGSDDGMLWGTWAYPTVRNNKVAVSAWMVEQLPAGIGISSSWDNNEYWWLGRQAPFSRNGVNLSFAQWKLQTGWDINSTLSTVSQFPDWAPVIRVVEPGRGHIAIFNGSRSSSRSVDLSSIVPAGSTFEIRNAQDYDQVVLSGAYNGGSVSLPMTGLNVMAPVGCASSPNCQMPAPTGPEFNAFVVIAATAGPSPNTVTPTPTHTPAAAFTATQTPVAAITSTRTPTSASTPTRTPTGLVTATPTRTPTTTATATSTTGLPQGFHAHWACRRASDGALRDTDVDATRPQPSCSSGWTIRQILVSHP